MTNTCADAVHAAICMVYVVPKGRTSVCCRRYRRACKDAELARSHLRKTRRVDYTLGNSRSCLAPI
eukprot:scaffold165249_cov39-Tisochrysis_lutea.AAC.2